MTKLDWIDDYYTESLPADSQVDNFPRQVNAAFSWVTPRISSHPKLVHVSDDMLHELGVAATGKVDNDLINLLSGKVLPNILHPYAMNYAGHQFGHWAGQLGDGRAINLGRMQHLNKTWALQLKGSGSTPYSRQGDGLAVLRSSIREHLGSEAMYHLGIPTTRSVSVVTTGDEVLRDIMYDGHAAYEPGAIVCRAAASFIRFGNFELFAARRDLTTLKTLTDTVITHHFPSIKLQDKKRYVAFFEKVLDRTLDMVIGWLRVGFVHGVMNTDNMSILGLTIDYGPYGWLESFDPQWTPNTTDRSGRYAYGNQVNVSLWNLVQLANTLVQLTEEKEPLQVLLDGFAAKYKSRYLHSMRLKLGLVTDDLDDRSLIHTLQENLEKDDIDFTIFFRQLSTVAGSSPQEMLTMIQPAFYVLPLSEQATSRWMTWLGQYAARIKAENRTITAIRTDMAANNPKYILRNYMAYQAAEAANDGDYSLVEELFTMLKKPYTNQPKYDHWYVKQPTWAREKIGCSKLSCSS